MRLTGKQLLGSDPTVVETDTFRAYDPVAGVFLDPFFCEASAEDVNRAVQRADAAFQAYRQTDVPLRSRFLEAIANQLEVVSTPLLERARRETGLPAARLEGELARTTGQIRMFARLLSDGGWQGLRVDTALPDRTPAPRPDLRSMRIAIGPVAVFGASNFPLAFSVAGGDTAAALAAGCPVIVKGHPAHPGTSEIAGRAIQAAVMACGLPEGTFSMVQGQTSAVGAALVEHPLLKAVAFTGSLTGGRALFDLAAARSEPIPVFAEMGSINPVFLMPQALDENAETIAEGYAASLVLGTGQFCTNPGLVVATRSAGLERFQKALQHCLAEQKAGVMLTPGICENFQARLQTVAPLPGVQALTPVASGSAGGTLARPALFEVDYDTWQQYPELAEEVFGPAAILVVCDRLSQFLDLARRLRGQLTATLHAGEDETAQCRELVRLLECKAGRLVFNGFPTGVEVCHAMVHGGPYPATTDSRFSSVGTLAIDRFLRPVCFQNLPDSLLPRALRSAAPSS